MPAAKRKSVFERHRFLAGLSVVAITLIVLAVIAEIGLRLAGVRAVGTVYTLVDELVVYDRFATDETGILKMSPEFDHGPGVVINEHGFRDQPIAEQVASGRPRIMFVGDSFTWGAAAEPMTRSFADLVEEDGYAGFNFGVAGVGPVQYATVTETYLPLVQPDLLAVMVFLGNDVNRFPMHLEPHKVPYYSTNADMIYAFDRKGRHMTAQEAYDYYCGDLYGRFEYYARKSVLLFTVGKKLVGLRNRIRAGRHREAEGGENVDRNQYAVDHLNRIDQLAEAAGTRCVFFLIPVQPSRQHRENKYENVRHVFDGLATVYVDFPEEEYESRTSHFNNAGHARMAGIVSEVFEDPGSDLISTP